jgi:hypothetical protein
MDRGTSKPQRLLDNGADLASASAMLAQLGEDKSGPAIIIYVPDPCQCEETRDMATAGSIEQWIDNAGTSNMIFV